MIVFIDRQHAGKWSKINDRGAGVDLDGDGKTTWEEQEATWTAYLSIMVENNLLAMGFKVIPLSDGSYSERHERVNRYYNKLGPETAVYLALHLNAGGGNYGSYFYDYRSTQGKSLADHLCQGTSKYVPEVTNWKSVKANPNDWTKNAYYTIKGIGQPVAICCEPIFMDTHKHLISIGGFSKIALGIAVGLREWEKEL